MIGGIFSLAAPHDKALTDPIRLAVREINMNGGLNNAQQIGVVFCDNGGPGDMATGTTRDDLDAHALDYLAGTLGVPYIVGPLTSADAIVLVGDLLKKKYPTVLISPSATSTALTMITDKLDPKDPYGLFWRTCPDDSLQAKVLATNVIGAATPAIGTVTIVYINDAYGVGLATGFQDDFGLMKTTLVPYEATTPNDSAALAKLGMMAAGTGSDAYLVVAEHGSVAIQIVEAMGKASTAVQTKPFFFTDGSMDSALLDPTLPAWVKTLLSTARGTAPASPSGRTTICSTPTSWQSSASAAPRPPSSRRRTTRRTSAPTASSTRRRAAPSTTGLTSRRGWRTSRAGRPSTSARSTGPRARTA